MKRTWLPDVTWIPDKLHQVMFADASRRLRIFLASAV